MDWKRRRPGFRCCFPGGSHLTQVDWKHNREINEIRSRQVLISPKWIGNEEQLERVGQAAAFSSHPSGLETSASACSLKFSSRSHLTQVDWKPMSTFRCIGMYSVLISPKWIGNLCRADLPISTTRFSSHPSGLETCRLTPPDFVAPGFSSHPSGLETDTNEPPVHTGHRSHLTQVDWKRYNMRLSNTLRSSSHLTQVDWKLAWTTRFLRPFTFSSHPSGLETTSNPTTFECVIGFSSHPSGLETSFLRCVML